VPPGQEYLWDNKSEFRLGATLAEAHRAFAGRLVTLDGTIHTFGQLGDRYLSEVTPNKSDATQTDEIQHFAKIREMIGDQEVIAFRPRHAYQMRDLIKQGATKGSGETYANKVMEKLKHLLTKAIEWGVIDDHPMIDSKFKMFPKPKTSQISRAESIDQVLDALPWTVEWMQLYVRLKILTGLRQVDLLRLTKRNITEEGLLVTLSKTKNTSKKELLFQWTPELKVVVDAIRSLPPSSIHFFTTQEGKLYIKDGRRTSAFKSTWDRWMDQLRKHPNIPKFSERSIRNLVGSEDDLQTASERLGHTSTTTTQQYYRQKPTKVVPLSAHNN
jgi:integrase